MDFTPIDLETWPRREHYEHYSALGCTYSVTTRLDSTALRRRGQKLYPTMLYHLAAAVNRHEEFRTALGPDGVPGVFSEMHPCYTVFHQDSETFSTCGPSTRRTTRLSAAPTGRTWNSSARTRP